MRQIARRMGTTVRGSNVALRTRTPAMNENLPISLPTVLGFTPVEPRDEVVTFRRMVGVAILGCRSEAEDGRVGHRQKWSGSPPTVGSHSPAFNDCGCPQAGPSHDADRGTGEFSRWIHVIPSRMGCPSPAKPTAAAPTRGPSVPSPPGTIRVPSECCRTATRSISACAAAKNSSP